MNPASRPHTPLVVGLLALSVAASGCSTPPPPQAWAGVGRHSFPTPLPLEEAPRDLLIQPGPLAVCEAQLAATRSELAQTQAAIVELEVELAATKAREPLLAAQIDDIEARRTQVAGEIAAAEQRTAASAAGIEQGRAAVRDAIRALAAARYDRDVEQISLARQERNRVRAALGGLPEDQSEVHLAWLQTRRAQERAEQEYVALVAVARARLQGEAEARVFREAAAERKLAALRRQLAEAESVLDWKRTELMQAHELLASLPIRLSRLYQERQRLSALERLQAGELRLAREALRGN